MKIMSQLKNKIHFGLLLFLAMLVLQGNAAETPAFTNSVGLRFVSIPKITNTMFCVWLTRVQDFRAFVSDRTNNADYQCKRTD
jgi:hypothetical protein